MDNEDLIDEIEDMILAIQHSIDIDTLVDRPDFGPGQVKVAEELKPGMVIVDHFRSGTERLLLLSEPYTNEYGRTSIEVTVWPPKEYLIARSTSLADGNVVPYANGRWNSTNWFEKTDEVVAPEQVKEVRKTHQWIGPCRRA